MISRDHRCIFIHIPKCAGSSIEDVLWPGPRDEQDLWMGFVDEFHNPYQTGGLQHLRAVQVRDVVGRETFDSYFTFTFVRNPFDRAVSQYVYMSSRPDLREFLDMPQTAAFGTYLELISAGASHVQWEPQHRFLQDDSTQEFLVDFVGRHENLDADARTVFSRLGMPSAALPHANRGARGHYRDYYGRTERELVETLYGRDLELFGYDF